jgi:hypothetical protein
MAYKIIQPPFTLKFREMSKTELKDYFRWFLDSIPERINELANAVSQTPGFETWQPDYTPASLDMLGEWLAAQVEMRGRTEEELQEVKNRSPYPIDTSEKELTNRTFSLAMDTGMYLSQVFLQNHPMLRWDQEFGDKKYVDYGQPVLIEFGPSPFNPVRMMVTQAYGLVSKNKTGKDLRRVYDYWSKQVRPGS